MWMFVFLQYPFLGPPSTRLGPALSSGSCQCQAAALQLSVHLQELESVGLGKKSNMKHLTSWNFVVVVCLFYVCFVCLYVRVFLFILPDAYFFSTRNSLLTLLDESSELQTQICNSFKSLVVQLQGELAAGFHIELFIWCVPLHLPSFFPQKFWIKAEEIYWKWKMAN